MCGGRLPLLGQHAALSARATRGSSTLPLTLTLILNLTLALTLALALILTSAGQLYPNDWYRLHRAVVVAMQGGETRPDAATAEEQVRDTFLPSYLPTLPPYRLTALPPYHLTTLPPYYLTSTTLLPTSTVPPHCLTTVPRTTDYPTDPCSYQELDAFRASLDVRAFFLSAPRMPLCERIDARCCQMLEGGLLEEVLVRCE